MVGFTRIMPLLQVGVGDVVVYDDDYGGDDADPIFGVVVWMYTSIAMVRWYPMDEEPYSILASIEELAKVYYPDFRKIYSTYNGESV